MTNSFSFQVVRRLLPLAGGMAALLAGGCVYAPPPVPAYPVAPAYPVRPVPAYYPAGPVYTGLPVGARPMVYRGVACHYYRGVYYRPYARGGYYRWYP